ncbi:MAG: cohesin domain-containing protein [Anaerolineae bacterium]|jgi:hypothetical protein
MSKIAHHLVLHRFLWLGIVAIAAALVAIPLASDAHAPLAATLYLDPVAATVPAGASTTVEIRVDGVSDLYGLQLELSFEPTAVEVVDADSSTAGTQITPGTCPAADFTVVNDASNASGVISYAVTALNPTPPCAGNGVVASIEFRALAEDTSVLQFDDWILANQDGMEIQADAQGGTLAATVPEVFLPLVVRDAERVTR